MSKRAPVAPREGWRRYLPSRRQFGWTLLGFVVVIVGLVGVGYATTDIPDPNAVASKQTTLLYYSDGKTVLGRIGAIDRVSVPLSRVPKHVRDAVLAAEDRNFYSEAGISPTGIARALWVDLRGGDVTQGGSTITQQYAKIAYLSEERTFTRKIREIFIAVKLDQQRSKDEILEDYLNTIYFGRGAYGIEAASRAYFGKDVDALDVSQGAFLAAVLNAPGYYDPANGPAAKQAVERRWQYVVDGMVKEGWLPAAQASGLHFPAVRNPGTSSGSGGDGPNGFVVQAVKKELARHGFDENRLNLGGYRVITTIDKQAQDAAIAAETANLPASGPLSALVAVQPGNGAVRAMYGGRDYGNPKIPYSFHNTATEPAPQPGSSFKPYVLLAALRQGIGLDTPYDGHSPRYDVPGYPPPKGLSNDSNEQCYYPCTLTQATAESINTVYVPLAVQVGLDKVRQAAYDAGIPTDDDLQAVPSLALGSTGVHVIDQAVGFATIAAKGVEADPYLVLKVLDRNGDTVYAAHPQTHRAFSADVAADATYALQQVIDSPNGTAHANAPLADGRPAAGKTGTTTENRAAWFVGFTPQLATAVWVGNADNSPLTGAAFPGGLYGGQTPAKMWKQFTDGALSGKPVLPLPPRAYVGQSSPAPGTGTVMVPPPVTSTPSPTASATATPSATASASTSPEPTTSAGGSTTPSAPPVTGEPSATAGAPEPRASGSPPTG